MGFKARSKTDARSADAMAHHEAGHYVVGLKVGRRPISVSIIPDGNSGGRVVGDEDFINPPGDDGISTVDEVRARAALIELFAGAAAQLRFGDAPETVEAAAEYDESEAARIFKLLDIVDDKCCRAEAGLLVERHWYEIHSLAEALPQHGELRDHAGFIVALASAENDLARHLANVILKDRTDLMRLTLAIAEAEEDLALFLARQSSSQT